MPEQLAPAEHVALRDLGAKATVQVGRTALTSLTIVNAQAAVIFVQLFDALIANVTLGTTNPDWEFSIPASSSAAVPIAANGISFHSGVVAGSTTGEKGATPSAAGVQAFFGII